MKVDVCDDGRCGGCTECCYGQARYYLDLAEERAKKAEQRVKELEEREQELVAKCIQKNSEYQIMLNMAQTYKDAQIKNPLNQSQSLALYWMNKALNLQNLLVRAQESE